MLYTNTIDLIRADTCLHQISKGGTVATDYAALERRIHASLLDSAYNIRSGFIAQMPTFVEVQRAISIDGTISITYVTSALSTPEVSVMYAGKGRVQTSVRLDFDTITTEVSDLRGLKNTRDGGFVFSGRVPLPETSLPEEVFGELAGETTRCYIEVRGNGEARITL